MNTGGTGAGMGPVVVDGAIALVLVAGIWLFRTPGRARLGNGAAALAVLLATALVVVRNGSASPALVVVGAGAGAAAGCGLAAFVQMIHIPPMVALQNGLGGLAAFLVSYAQLTGKRPVPLAPTAEGAAILGLMVGAATFSGSLVASGKLLGRLRQTPMELPRHGQLVAGLTLAGLVAATGLAVTARGAPAAIAAALVAGLALAFGVALAVRVGGADMPVLISFLNALSGLAAALCGLTLANRLLIVCGATVAASGLVLTRAMCRAMNRNLGEVFAGRALPSADAPAAAMLPEEVGQEGGAGPAAPPEAAVADALEHSLALLREAERVIVIPGYGMALADAQQEVVQLADALAATGKEVLFAIHPVAGRMPGHMHVLLAEAEVDYEMIRELDEVNEVFAQTDVAVVVGACDVVNPAAMASEGTPISGMPILKAHEARSTIVCNLDDRPGYSGVENALYPKPDTVLLLGDAKETVSLLLSRVARQADSPGAPPDQGTAWQPRVE